jgi:transcriptional regulator with XRE-family HTH domain
MELGIRIKRLRFEKNISQKDLAMASQVSQSTISKWESGATIPNAYNIVALAKCLDVTTDYLLGLEGF